MCTSSLTYRMPRMAMVGSKGTAVVGQSLGDGVQTRQRVARARLARRQINLKVIKMLAKG